MRAIPTVILLTIGCLVINLTGCQIGKPSLGSLTWWKKNDDLASKYVEPPSHQFSPSESAIVSDDPNLPPLPPDIEKTVESFQQEIDRSYRELAKDSQKANQELIESLEKGTSELMQIAEQPPTKSPVSTANATALIPMPTPQAKDFSNQTIAQNTVESNPTAQPSLGSNKSDAGSFKPGGGGSFQAYSTPQATTEDSNGFKLTPTEVPNYERVADKTFAPSTPGQLEPSKPTEPSPSSTFVPYKTEPSSGNPSIIPNLPKGLEPKATSTYPSTPHKPFEAPATNTNEQMVNAFIPNDTPELGNSVPPSSSENGINNGSFVPPNPAALPKLEPIPGSTLDILPAKKQGGYTPGSTGPLDDGGLSLPPIPGTQ